jgi:hypothetical protein
MDELGLDIDAIVKVLAEALVHYYWRAHVEETTLSSFLRLQRSQCDDQHQPSQLLAKS